MRGQTNSRCDIVSAVLSTNGLFFEKVLLPCLPGRVSRSLSKYAEPLTFLAPVGRNKRVSARPRNCLRAPQRVLVSEHESGQLRVKTRVSGGGCACNQEGCKSTCTRSGQHLDRVNHRTSSRSSRLCSRGEAFGRPRSWGPSSAIMRTLSRECKQQPSRSEGRWRKGRGLCYGLIAKRRPHVAARLLLNPDHSPDDPGERGVDRRGN